MDVCNGEGLLKRRDATLTCPCVHVRCEPKAERGFVGSVHKILQKKKAKNIKQCIVNASTDKLILSELIQIVLLSNIVQSTCTALAWLINKTACSPTCLPQSSPNKAL